MVIFPGKPDPGVTCERPTFVAIGRAARAAVARPLWRSFGQ
jgi:hypothetical protein